MLRRSSSAGFVVSGGVAGGGGCLWLQTASFVEARIRWVRDRGLDHAVEKEKNLRPLLSLKNLITAEPSKSLPVSVAAEHKSRIGLPLRAVEFVRRYPSVFVEFPSAVDYRRPHVRLTHETLDLHQEEGSAYELARSETADRLLKLLMLTPERKLPLPVVDRLKWDLGLPDDYIRSLIPEFPDYFDVTGSSGELFLDLVWWSKDLAVSVMERRASTSYGGYRKGMPLAFPLHFPPGFDLEKKVKKWVDEWQKLPYISPYETGSHLNAKSDIGEKWLVGVLHELFHLFVAKKAEKETVLLLGECLGLRPGFKKVLSQHPGIFYVSNKLRTHTVVLREAYKRDLLVEKHPLMSIRFQYIHLMNKSRAASKISPVRFHSEDAPAKLIRKAVAHGREDSEDESSESFEMSEDETNPVSEVRLGQGPVRRGDERRSQGPRPTTIGQ